MPGNEPNTVEAAIGRNESESIEMRMLAEAVYLKYGYDFRGYAQASYRRRVKRCMERLRLDSVGELMHRVLHESTQFEQLLSDLSVTVTEMFRDPFFFATMRNSVFTELAHNVPLKIWDAGCASGEEVYSLAIIMHELGLLEYSRIYATDFNEAMLFTARKGIMPLERMNSATQAYQRAGGRASFADYYHAKYESALLDAKLLRPVLFSHHNLATDGSFGEFDLIVCRNVLIYFGRDLQVRVLRLFAESLHPGGLLAIGPRESIQFTGPWAQHFELIDTQSKIYRFTGR